MFDVVYPDRQGEIAIHLEEFSGRRPRELLWFIEGRVRERAGEKSLLAQTNSGGSCQP
jgi:hypothetical protein